MLICSLAEWFTCILGRLLRHLDDTGYDALFEWDEAAVEEAEKLVKREADSLFRNSMYSKTSLKKSPNYVFKTDTRLMHVKSIL